MLSFFRNAAQTWVFKGLFALLIVSFAVWGIGDISLTGRGSAVATVAGRDITVDDYATALQREMQSASQRIGRRLTVDEAQQAGLPQILLARLIRDEAIDAEAEKLGLSADDAAVRRAILKSPSFQGLDGTFDQEQYRFILQRLGFRPEAFEADMRDALARDVLNYAVAAGVPATPGFAEALGAHALETRRFDALRLTAETAPAPEAPTDAELAAYVEAHRGDYMIPESRSVRWIAIIPEDFVARVEISEEDLRAAYEERIDSFRLPERRAVAQIGFDDMAAAEAAKAAIESGETSFDALLEERGLTMADVSLGTGGEAEFSPDVAAAAFALTEPGPAGPVDGAFGPALVYVSAVEPASETPFYVAREALQRILATDIAHDEAVGAAEQAADLVASGAGIAGVAEELGLPLQTADLTEAGNADLPYGADPLLLAEVFEAAPGEERDVIETEAGGWALAMVDAVNPAAEMSLEQARPAATAALELERRLDALEAQAEAALTTLAEGGTIASLAEELGVPVETVGPLRRGAEGALPADLLQTLFAAPAAGAAMARDGDAVVIGQVAEIIPADLKSAQVEEQLFQLRQQLQEGISRDLEAYFAAAVQERSDAQIYPDLMNQVVNQIR